MKAGDILLFRNTGFVPKGIQFFMNIYRKKKGLPKQEVFNHVGVVVELWGKLMIAEADKEGVTVHREATQYIGKNNVKHLTWITPLTEEETKLFNKTAINYSLKVTRYDFLNFPAQIRYILWGKWKGKTGEESKVRLYCSEFAACCMDEVRGSFDGVTWNKNPLDIELCEDLKEAV